MSAPDLSKLHIDRDAASLAPRRRRRWINKWTVGTAVVIVIAVAMMVRSSNAPATVEIATVTMAFPSQSFTVLNATGRVAAWRKAAVSTKATGRLEWLGVQEGTRVKAGEVIARLESLDVAANRDSAAANLNVAKANLEQGDAEMRDADNSYKRARELFDQKFISESSLDAARARSEKAHASISSLKAAIGVAEAQVRAASVSVEHTLIRAPFDGIVLTKNANVGDIITPFSSATDSKGAVVNMADMETLEVEADVAEASIAKIKVSMPTEIQLDAYPDLRLMGEVSRIVPTVDRTKATLLVKVSFRDKDARVLPDMSAKIAFLSRAPTADERRPVTAVRPEAVVKRGDRSVVFLLDPGLMTAGAGSTVAHEVTVTTRKLGDLTEVSGVKAGDKVVISPPERMREGSPAAIAKK